MLNMHIRMAILAKRSLDAAQDRMYGGLKHTSQF